MDWCEDCRWNDEQEDLCEECREDNDRWEPSDEMLDRPINSDEVIKNGSN
jgi:hypothetical protein